MRRSILGRIGVTENRYADRERHRQERHKLHLLDADMQLNEKIDVRDQYFREEQKRRDVRRRQHLRTEL